MRITAGNGSISDCLDAFDYIKACIERLGCDETPDEAFAFVLNRRDLLWRVEDDGKIVAAAITRRIVKPNGNAEILIFAMGGKGFPKWGRAALREIETYAMATGCKAVTFGGRKAWRKLIPEYAFDGVWYERTL